MRLPSKKSTAAAALLMSLIHAASGQDTEPGPVVEPAPQRVTISTARSGSDYRLTESSSFTKTDTPLQEIPGSITVLPAQLIRDLAMQSLADVIRQVPGALAHQGEGNRDEFIFRGIGSSANLYVDGVRDDAQVFRDLYNLERVEVIKGAPGMIFGRGAGGILNRVTKKPVFGSFGEVTWTLGSHDQVRGTLDAGGQAHESIAWRINAMGEDTNSFREGAGLQRHALNPTVIWKLDVATSLLLGAEHLHDERTADRGVSSFNGKPIDAPRGLFFGNADQSTARAQVDGAYAIVEQDFEHLQVKNTLRFTRYDKFYQNVFPATTIAVRADGLVTLNAYNNRNRRDNVFNQTDLTGTWKIGAVEHAWLAGLELGHQFSRNQRNTGFFGADMATTYAIVSAQYPVAQASLFRANGSDTNNLVEADIVAVYLQDQITLSPNWKMLAGLRHDRFKVNLEDRRTTLSATTTPTAPTDLARTDTAFSPRLGLIWMPSPGSSYYVSQSQSFLPSAENLSLTVLDRNSGVSTADFAAETAQNIELGGRWDLARRLTLSAAVFRLDRNHVRNPDGNGGFVQSGQQRTQGIELGLHGEVKPSWYVAAGYAHLVAKITQAPEAAGTLGHVPALVPQNTGSVWNQVAVAGGVSLGIGLIYQGASFPNVNNAVQLPSFTRSDAAIHCKFKSGKSRLSLNLENLFDKKYYPTADANNNISVGAPRLARLTLSMAI